MCYFSLQCKVGCVPHVIPSDFAGEALPAFPDVFAERLAEPRRRHWPAPPPDDIPDSLAAALDAVLIAAFSGRLDELLAEARRLRERKRRAFDALITESDDGPGSDTG